MNNFQSHMFTHLYILDGKTAVPVDDVLVWGEWFQKADRHVKDEIVNGHRVSTVFLGLDHSYGYHEKPVLFETMVFSVSKYHPDNEYIERCSTWDEAEKMHERVKGMLILNELFGGVELSDTHVSEAGKVTVPKSRQMINRLKHRK